MQHGYAALAVVTRSWIGTVNGIGQEHIFVCLPLLSEKSVMGIIEGVQEAHHWWNETRQGENRKTRGLQTLWEHGLPTPRAFALFLVAFYFKTSSVRASVNMIIGISTVQQVCIPQAILGTDVLCQAKSGLGKTAVFVLTTLQQVDPVPGETSVLVMCHTRELAYQIKNEYARFAKYMPDVRTSVFYGGTAMQKDVEVLKNKDQHPHIIVATPGRLNALVRDKHLRLGSIKVFVLDECDKMLEQIGMHQLINEWMWTEHKPDMRRDVQEIFRATPQQKQVMMFSATLSTEIRPICKKFMQSPLEIYVDDETKLTLHGLQQYYVKLEEKEKNRKLNELLDQLEFNQVIIFVKSTLRATELNRLLTECNFPSIAVHSGIPQEERYATPAIKRQHLS